MNEHWMSRCLQLGREALANGNPPVGSVLVKEGQIIGEGREAGKSKNDITCHAEIEAIRDALQKGITDFTQTTLYTTHEPCLMCSYVIRHYRLAQVVMGVEVSQVGGYTSKYPILQTTDISSWGPPPQVITGVLQEQCESLNLEFKNSRR